MVVFGAADAPENNFLAVGLVVAIVVGEEPHVWTLRHDDAVADDRNTQRRVEFRALVKHLRKVSFAVAVGVFQNQNTVARQAIFLRARLGVAVDVGAEIVGVAHPYAAPVVHVDAGGIGDRRLGGKQRSLEALGHVQSGHGEFGEAFFFICQ